MVRANSRGIGTKSTPATARISCASCTARSASPRATGDGVERAAGQAEPRRKLVRDPEMRSTAAKCTPLTPPLSGSVITIERMPSSQSRNVSAEPISGLATPVRTAMPTSVLAIATMNRDRSSRAAPVPLSVAAGSIARSNASPATIRSRDLARLAEADGEPASGRLRKARRQIAHDRLDTVRAEDPEDFARWLRNRPFTAIDRRSGEARDVGRLLGDEFEQRRLALLGLPRCRA